MANNRMSVLPAPPGPALPTSGVFVDRAWSGSGMPTNPVCATSLILYWMGKQGPNAEKQDRQPAWAKLTPTRGLLRAGPQRPKLRRQPHL